MTTQDMPMNDQEQSINDWEDYKPTPIYDGDRTYFGQITVNRRDLVQNPDRTLRRGTDGQPLEFDASEHDEESRCRNAQVIFEPLVRFDSDAMPQQWKRDYRSFAVEWKQHLYPTLIAKRVRAGQPTWVQVLNKKIGTRPRNDTGEVIDIKAYEIIEVYPSEAACRAASDAFWESRRRGDASDTPPVAATNGSAGATATTGAGDSAAKRTAALRFLRLTVKSAFPDWDALEAKLAVEPFKSAGVGPGSQEVLDEWEKLAVAEGA